MAAAIYRHVVRVFKLRPTFISNEIFQGLKSNNSVGFRLIYTEQFLGIDKYKEQRERTKVQFGNMKERFHTRMTQYFNNDGQPMVFTEDLKNMVYLAEDKEEDIELCLKMMQRFNHQNKELRFSTFVFGPVAMRLFYFLDKPDIVLRALNDKQLDGFFDQITSYHIALDLLFKHQRYQDLVDCYEQLRKKQLYGTKFPRECMVLVLAACYKLNTTASYQHALNLVKQAREAGANIIRKGVAFMAALAVNQNDPKTAMEILAITPQQNYITVKNLRIITLAELDRLDDAFPILRSIVDQDVPKMIKTTNEISQTTMEKIQVAVERSGDKEMTHIFEQICRALKDGNHINPSSLDDLLCESVKSKPPPRDKPWIEGSGYYSSLHRPPQGYPRNTMHQRQGLRDMDE
ncbi:pentatricopeptide repeat-containing protein 2, mitochondrial-like [Tachypleus tridentatus]|uniref:pentatricopeptide repeat-containing protein 2, mitochondrial-like n=1 Tax=Tachypleus tridentatus TaxID=6853 RepID=UPI003FD29923